MPTYVNSDQELLALRPDVMQHLHTVPLQGIELLVSLEVTN
jgi:hypothetical protein